MYFNSTYILIRYFLDFLLVFGFLHQNRPKTPKNPHQRWFRPFQAGIFRKNRHFQDFYELFAKSRLFCHIQNLARDNPKQRKIQKMTIFSKIPNLKWPKTPLMWFSGVFGPISQIKKSHPPRDTTYPQFYLHFLFPKNRRLCFFIKLDQKCSPL